MYFEILLKNPYISFFIATLVYLGKYTYFPKTQMCNYLTTKCFSIKRFLDKKSIKCCFEQNIFQM